MVQLLVYHHAAIDQPTDVSNALYNIIIDLSLFFSVLFTESPAYSVLLTSSLLSYSPQDEPFATPLMAASVRNQIEVARFLVEHEASIIRFLITSSYFLIILLIIPLSCIEFPPQYGNSALQVACD